MPANSKAAAFFRYSILATLVAALFGCDGSFNGNEPALANVALSGIIDIETGTRVDSDDAGTLALSASPLRRSQLLPQEFILAGYISASSGTYPGFNELNYPADPVDAFSMTLREGQTIYLQPFSTREGVSPLTLSLLSGSRVIETVSTDNQPGSIRVSLPNAEVAGIYTVQVEAAGAGIAYNASLLPVRVLGEGGTGSSADLLAALHWVAGPTDGEPLADIVNLSLGGLPFQPRLRDAIDYGARRGIVFVAAAGNSASTLASYPAAYGKVFAVSAVDGAGVLASYSNSGDWIDLAAPGGDASRDDNADGRSDLISSTSASLVNGILQETYIGLQGTSMAAPHVSAVFALMKNLDSSLNYEKLNIKLVVGDLTATDCGSPMCPKSTELGWGLLDAGKSALAASTGTVSDFLTASPSIVSLSTEGELSASVSLNVYGSNPDDIIIDSVSVAAPWLRLDSPLVNEGSGTDFEINLTLNPRHRPAGDRSAGS
ncbi:S8 family serine peptidase [Marinobacter sp. LV10R510-11A]|uniref:S8 family serine peptidase n=1 Tax=Marinobacter sp. LV10R510-11A TaxID=1415568 RepID=UPI0012FD8F5C|nr:S8 family serine peptidase [Marinobacter sp. LV10R510-11A]